MRPPTASGTHVVITLHGIRTYGQWQERLGHLLKEREPDVEVYHYHYGYFSVLAFLAPPARWLEVRRFRRWLLHLLAEHPRARRIDLVAHSFGTHLLGWALRGLPPWQRCRFHTVILAGSVLTAHFPWDEMLRSGRVGRVVNECG